MPEICIFQRKTVTLQPIILNDSEYYTAKQQNDNDMDALFRRNADLLKDISTKFVRSIMDDIPWDDRLVAIRGARGVGKTTLMLQYQKLHYGDNENHKSLYVRLDNAYFAQHNLVDVAERFYRQGGELLLVDEVHNAQYWAKEIKEIYDVFKPLRVVFTGSSLLHILNAQADLSRRCLSYDMQGLSFREYMQLYHNIELPKATLDDILHNSMDVAMEVHHKCRPLEFFPQYLQKGYYPFGVEGFNPYYQRVESIVDLLLNIELPQLRGVEVGNVRKLKALLAVISTEVPMVVDVSKLSTLVGVSRVTLLAYLQYLQEAKLIRLLYSDDLSVKKMQKPDKILMENSNLLYALSLEKPNVGTVRETFFCNQLGYKHQVEYNKRGDYLIDHKLTFEIGGKSKDGKQIAQTENAYIISDDFDYPLGNKLPMWLFGLMY